MPIYKTISDEGGTTIHIWKIEETFEELRNGLVLTENSISRLSGMKSQLHQKGFLSVRHLLKHAGYEDANLYYNEYGRPSLSEEDLVKQLTVIWGAKESMYKTYPYGGLSFHNHIGIDPFLFADGRSSGRVIFDTWKKTYDIKFEFLKEGFTLVYALVRP